MVETGTLLIAFGLTLFAGLSTGIGSALAFFAKKTSTRFLSLSLGFSAGVMIYVSFVEIFAEANHLLGIELGEAFGAWITVASFFAGILIAGVIDRVIPALENPHELRGVENLSCKEIDIKKVKKLYSVGLIAAVVIALHNFPEGFATFASALQNVKIGIPIAIAIALHNIPEGIAISVPIFCATGSKKKAFKYSFLSGLAEPLGALIGYLFLSWLFSGLALGVTFAVVAGIMVFISVDQLLPAAEKYGQHHLSIIGLLSGMGVMAVSLLLFM